MRPFIPVKTRRGNSGAQKAIRYSIPMTTAPVRCLILACGNTLRADDGVGPFLAQWAEERFQAEPGVQVIARHQWTPELAEDAANAHSVLFIDCSIDAAPGSVRLLPVEPAPATAELATHHLGAAELLALARRYYNSLPQHALLLTVGAGSLELNEEFSDLVQAALPQARHLLESTVLRLIGNSSQ
jgi:hydrogenase maturation protease